MDPSQLQMLMQLFHQGQGGMFGGGQPQMMGQMAPQQMPMQPPAPQIGQMPQMQQPDGRLPAMGQGDEKKHHGLSPLMFLSPFGAMMSQSPKTAMSMMSPMLGMLGAFK